MYNSKDTFVLSFDNIHFTQVILTFKSISRVSLNFSIIHNTGISKGENIWYWHRELS